MSYNGGTILTPGASRKRKEREEPFFLLKPSASSKPAVASKLAPKSDQQLAMSSNRLLAGYMAHEFLTKGTLFGQKFDPARAEAVPLAGGSLEWKRGKVEAEPGGIKEHRSYAEVASILKTEGAHVPDIVNPTELARWIQM